MRHLALFHHLAAQLVAHMVPNFMLDWDLGRSPKDRKVYRHDRSKYLPHQGRREVERRKRKA